VTALRPFVCVGAAHWDLIARAAAPLAPGADVPGRVHAYPGGVALNVALALAARGAPAALVAAIGRDAAGDRLVAAVARARIDTRLILRHDGETDAYLAIETPEGALHAAVADCRGLEERGAGLLDPLAEALRGAAGLVVDANLPEAVIAALSTPFLVALVAASPEKATRLRRALVLPGATLYANLAEAEAILGRAIGSAEAAVRELAQAGVAAALVTDGPREAAWTRAGRILRRRPPTASPRSVTGAGDALVAAHLHARALGADDAAALETALAAAATHIARELP
jgi:sugar/nucleoside kinase (ribokinase family)